MRATPQCFFSFSIQFCFVCELNNSIWIRKGFYSFCKKNEKNCIFLSKPVQTKNKNSYWRTYFQNKIKYNGHIQSISFKPTVHAMNATRSFHAFCRWLCTNTETNEKTILESAVHKPNESIALCTFPQISCSFSFTPFDRCTSSAHHFDFHKCQYFRFIFGFLWKKLHANKAEQYDSGKKSIDEIREKVI